MRAALGYVVGATVSLTGGLADLAYINVRLVPRVIEPKPELEALVPIEPEPIEADPIEGEPLEVAAAIEVPSEPVEVLYELAAVVRFKTSSDVLTRAARAEIDRIAKRLLQDPDLSVRTFGHADVRGPPLLNQQLSERRAAAVARELERLGIEPTRIDQRGFGEKMASDEWFVDRRVEISIGVRRASGGLKR